MVALHALGQPAPQPPGARAAALQASLPNEARQALCPASELGRRVRRQLPDEPLVTTLDALDRLLGGGLPQGELVELYGRASCGRHTALLTTLAAVTGSGETAALVDLGQHLDPQTAAVMGVALERLLWLRLERLPDALAAAEALVGAGFALVAVDLGLPPVRGRSPLAAWLRLARSAAAHRATVLVSSPYRLSQCAASTVLHAGRGRGQWAGAVGSRRLLFGLATSLTLVKRRGQRAGERRPLLLAHPAAIASTTSPAEITPERARATATG